MNPDPRTSLAETEVAKILHLKRITDETPDGLMMHLELQEFLLMRLRMHLLRLQCH